MLYCKRQRFPTSDRQRREKKRYQITAINPRRASTPKARTDVISDAMAFSSALPARRQELGCRLLFWRCPSHFARSPWKREGRHWCSSSSARAPGDFLRSETCPHQPGSSDPSRDALVTSDEREADSEEKKCTVLAFLKHCGCNRQLTRCLKRV